MKINTKIITREEPHSIRYSLKDLMKKFGVYKVVYPENFRNSYKDNRLVSVSGGVLFVSNNLSIIKNYDGWIENRVEFELVDTDVSFTITEK